MGSSRVTLRDVAAASGVSPSTASFVLNKTPTQSISAPTRARVEQAARELGYVPNGIARALREGASRLVVLHVDSTFEGNYSRTYVRGLDEELAAHGHVLLVRHGRTSAKSTKEVLDTVSPRAVLEFGERYLTGRVLDDEGRHDGMAANTALQVHHLHERGHRHLAFAVPERGRASDLARIRARFAAQAARSLGLPSPARLQLPADPVAARESLQVFRGAHPAVSAVAAFDDLVALRVLAAAGRLGLDVPGDLAVIGFDATEYAATSTPGLTTVHIEAEVHGRIAARSVLGMAVDDLGDAAPGRVIQRASS
ncbi:LacI family DNA-binding transcriptional regulator [Kineococcus arenarius]|uniref:LacI family DNA-binding transcriptional regulator n=1 Tax=unclassified Kineococcus TaxID=2621656 RepID=UPI003D7C565A